MLGSEAASRWAGQEPFRWEKNPDCKQRVYTHRPNLNTGKVHVCQHRAPSDRWEERKGRKRLSEYIRPSSAKFNPLNACSHLTWVRSGQAHFFYFYQQTSPSWGAQVLARSTRNSLSTYFILSPTKTAAAFQKIIFQQLPISCKRRVSLNYLKTPRPQEYKMQLSTNGRCGHCPSSCWVTASNHHLSVNDTSDQTITLQFCCWTRGNTGSSHDIWDFSSRFILFLLSADETETRRWSCWLKAAEGAAPPAAPGSSSPRSPVFQLSEQSPEQAGPPALHRQVLKPGDVFPRPFQVRSVPKACCPRKTAAVTWWDRCPEADERALTLPQGYCTQGSRYLTFSLLLPNKHLNSTAWSKLGGRGT